MERSSGVIFLLPRHEVGIGHAIRDPHWYPQAAELQLNQKSARNGRELEVGV